MDLEAENRRRKLRKIIFWGIGIAFLIPILVVAVIVALIWSGILVTTGPMPTIF